MNKTKFAREERLSKYLGLRKEIIHEPMPFLDTKFEKTVFEFILFYLGTNNEEYFYQITELTTEPEQYQQKNQQLNQHQVNQH